MKILPALLLLTVFKAHLCLDIKEFFNEINKKTEKFNAVAAEIAWESSTNPGNPNLPLKAAKYQKQRIKWQQKTCDELATLHISQLLNSTQSRQTYLMCRGPKFTFGEARLTSQLYEKLQSIYTEAEICVPTENKISKENQTQVDDAILKYLTKRFLKADRIIKNKYFIEFTKDSGPKRNHFCLKGEDDFQRIMAFSRNDAVLEWLWLVWREKMIPLKELYRQLIGVENSAARRNGYPDIGSSWREEHEIPNLQHYCRHIYNKVRHLYTMLHGVVRFYLRKEYGRVVPERGPIPAHLLGNLWSQNWEPLADLILPKTIDLDESITKLNWTVEHMVKRAEDFYVSLGLPSMTEKFWNNSVFRRNSDNTRCHGAAADMFSKNDFRLLYCSGTTMNDFYILHHELGHIQYYMAYEHQPALFRQANTAFHEAIGDTIMYGVMTPQHLYRLNLINDSILYDTNENNNKNDYDDDDENNLNDNYGFIHSEDNVRDNLKFNDKTFKNVKIDAFGDTKENYVDKETDFDKFGFVKEKISNTDEYINENNKVYDINNFSNKDKDYKIISNLKHKKLNNKIDMHITADDILILKQGLNKIPQIPFSLLIDEYRWRYFKGDIKESDVNKIFWEMSLELQGISPPLERGTEYFDVGAKFHVPDNTPYIRYFLSSFLQHQIFENLCKASVFGRRDVKDPLPDSILLHRCDIYGSKSAGKLLKDIMSRGHSQHWQQILKETINNSDISTSSLERYYQPLYKLLTKLIRTYRIRIGW